MRAADHLYPPAEPFAQQMLSVGDGHEIYVEQSGTPGGIPFVVCHGGPGGGCSPFMRRYFDPDHCHIVLFDQRGCGRSTPHASLEANTTWHLLRDMEAIRTQLGLDSWHVFGGSWGATLALIYAQEHPQAVRSLILRGVFLLTQPELDWFYGGGAARFWPDLWRDFCALIPEPERGDMIGAYHQRLFGADPTTQLRYARAWTAWENALAFNASTGIGGTSPAEHALAFARIEAQYFKNLGWLAPDQAILARAELLRGLPGVIIQGRQDMICPPQAAYDLARVWPEAHLRMIPNAGHAMTEPGITAALVQATRRAVAQDRL